MLTEEQLDEMLAEAGKAVYKVIMKHTNGMGHGFVLVTGDSRASEKVGVMHNQHCAACASNTLALAVNNIMNNEVNEVIDGREVVPGITPAPGVH